MKPKLHLEYNSRRITIRDVAQRLNLSISAISHALSKPHLVSQKTVERVRKEVEKVGYHPNSIAQDLKMGSVNTVFVVVPSFCPDTIEALDGIEAAAADLGYVVMIAHCGSNPTRQQEYLDLAFRGRAAGAIVMPSSSSVAGSLRKTPPYPVVSVLCASEERKVSSVSVDYLVEAEKATKYLIGLGHRRIGFIDSGLEDPFAEKRYRGYTLAMTVAGLAARRALSLTRKCDYDGGKSAMLTLLKRKKALSAVLVGSEEMALGAIQAVGSTGLRVPQDISVMGFGVHGACQSSDPPLTCVHVPAFDIGYQARTKLSQMIQGTPFDHHTILAGRLVERGSVVGLFGTLN